MRILLTAVLAVLLTGCARGEPSTITIDPKDWAPEASAWDATAPNFEGNPALGETRLHAWGYGHGQFAYAFEIDGTPGGSATVTATISSEHPGYSSPPEWLSDVTLLVNDVTAGTKTTIADDGAGAPVTWSFDGSLLKSGANLIVFRVADDAANANGICIYQDAAVAGVDDARIEVAGTW